MQRSWGTREGGLIISGDPKPSRCCLVGVGRRREHRDSQVTEGLANCVKSLNFIQRAKGSQGSCFKGKRGPVGQRCAAVRRPGRRREEREPQESPGERDPGPGEERGVPREPVAGVRFLPGTLSPDFLFLRNPDSVSNAQEFSGSPASAALQSFFPQPQFPSFTKGGTSFRPHPRRAEWGDQACAQHPWKQLAHSGQTCLPCRCPHRRVRKELAVSLAPVMAWGWPLGGAWACGATSDCLLPAPAS